jgi:hypothetical protein
VPGVRAYSQLLYRSPIVIFGKPSIAQCAIGSVDVKTNRIAAEIMRRKQCRSAPIERINNKLTLVGKKFNSFFGKRYRKGRWVQVLLSDVALLVIGRVWGIDLSRDTLLPQLLAAMA